jgi:hypothetical protein
VAGAGDEGRQQERPLPILRGEEQHGDEDLFGVHGGVSDDLPDGVGLVVRGNRS